ITHCICGLMQVRTTNSVNRVPRLAYRIARLRRRAQQLEALSSKYWVVRRVIFASGSLLALLFCKYSGKTAVILACLFLIVFVVVAVYHNRVRDSILRNAMMINIKQIQLARINLDWEQLSRVDQALPESGPPPEHPFATDLDVTGERSLHRLLDSAVTKEGSRRLKSWLLSNRPDR